MAELFFEIKKPALRADFYLQVFFGYFLTIAFTALFNLDFLRAAVFL